MEYLKKPTLENFKIFLEIYKKRPFKNNDGGIKVAKNGSGSEVLLEFGYWTRS